MINKKILVVSLSALVLGVGIVSAGTVLAYKGNAAAVGPNYTADRHQAMTQAFANNDYNAWKNLMQGMGRFTNVINQQNFAKFAQAHKLTLEGKTAEAQQIRLELGLGLNSKCNGGNGGNGGCGGCGR